MVTLKRLSVKLYIYCLSCYSLWLYSWDVIHLYSKYIIQHYVVSLDISNPCRLELFIVAVITSMKTLYCTYCPSEINRSIYTEFGRGSSVGIETEVRDGRSGIESRWVRDFLPVQNGPGAHLASCIMGMCPVVEAAGAWGWAPHPI